MDEADGVRVLAQLLCSVISQKSPAPHEMGELPFMSVAQTRWVVSWSQVYGERESPGQVLTPEEDTLLDETCVELNAHGQGVTYEKLGGMVVDALPQGAGEVHQGDERPYGDEHHAAGGRGHGGAYSRGEQY